MKNLSALIILFLFFCPFLAQNILAQNQEGPIYLHLQSAEMQRTLSQPYQWSNSEQNAFNSIFNSQRFSMNMIGQGNFNMTNVNQLRVLKDLLDLLPSDNTLINKRTIGIGGSYCCSGTTDPCIFQSPNNSHRYENQLTVNFNTGSAQYTSAPVLFDINTKDICSGKVDPVFYVDLEKRFGFGTNTPQAKYHFVTPDFLVGNTSSVYFKINGQSKTLTFSDGAKELLKIDGNGLFCTRRIKVTTVIPFPDYVFDKDYKLMPLNELSVYLTKNKHLPNINSADMYIKEEGVDVGELQLKMLEKIEELTLYILQQEKRIEVLEKR